MKILAIRLKNLTSIEGTVEIDFTSEPLCSTGIFAISGPTGAGKSTLLDALCLALYDKAPRFSNSVESINLSDVGDNMISQSDVRNLLRRGTVEGFAEVDFVGVTGYRYRARWSVRRTKNKIDGSLRPQVMEVQNLDTLDELQGTKRELLEQLTELVGLTYDQFTRTVLLAQNDFATFLKSKGSAKAELLEKLTGTDIYSRISQEIFARNKAAQEEVNLIGSKISMLELLPEEEHLALLEQKKSLQEQRTVNARLLSELNEQLTVTRSLKEKEALWKKKKEEESTERRKEEELTKELLLRSEGLAQFRAQCEAIQPDLRKARQLDVQISTQLPVYQQVEESVVSIRKQCDAQKATCRSDNTDFQAASNILITLFKDKATSLNLDRVEYLLGMEEDKLFVKQKTNDELSQRINSLGYLSLVEEQGKWEKELTCLRETTLLKANKEEQDNKVVQLEKELEELKQLQAGKENEVQTLKRLYDTARLAMGKDVKALREQLNPGDPCPVCGSQHHPYYQEQEKVNLLYGNIEQEYNESAKAFQELNNRNIALQKDIEHLRSSLKQIYARLQVLQNERLQGDWQEEQIVEHLKRVSGAIEEYRRLYANWQKEDEDLKRIRVNIEKLRKAVTEYKLSAQRLKASTEKLELLQNTQAAEVKRFQRVSEELEKLRQERSGLLKGKSADEAETAMLKHEKQLIDIQEKARKDVEAIKACISGLQGELRQLTITIDELRNRFVQIESPDDLPQRIKECQDRNEETERSISGLDLRLLQQAKNKKLYLEISNELAQKTQVSDRWAKLNKLIGSADGTKFKVIAQSYTLNLLLRHANRHLSYLSRRYKLQQVPDSLGLQVIDHDMCDEIRTVYSLSGGESFLISLALALGLSSLSSNNLKVESLFIDEGFGSLDADSLRTAMEALEQLQMQGRKIGVISHVQEMSERITVQVQVNKKVNGKSSLTVVG